MAKKMAKFGICGKMFDEICTFWRTKNGIFGGKILCSLLVSGVWRMRRRCTAGRPVSSAVWQRRGWRRRRRPWRLGVLDGRTLRGRWHACREVPPQFLSLLPLASVLLRRDAPALLRQSQSRLFIAYKRQSLPARRTICLTFVYSALSRQLFLNLQIPTNVTILDNLWQSWLQLCVIKLWHRHSLNSQKYVIKVAVEQK